MTTRDPFAWEPGAAALSPEGTARREAIIGLARRTLRTRVRRRRAARGAGALGVLAAVGVIAYVAITGRPAAPAPPVIARDPRQTGEPPAVRVTYVRTDESIAVRASIGDDELFRLLGEAGRPAGLVRVLGRTMLTTELEPVPAGTGAPSGRM